MSEGQTVVYVEDGAIERPSLYDRAAKRSLSTRMRQLGHEFSEEHLLPGRSDPCRQAEPAT
jgi:hypothetical protein